ncbi:MULTISPECIES: DUF177 domain-containing protein [unclassified Thioalkalivibrio]|uniref:YceD family protein n=1 Tax=unclassified Thioalkalivibrio TaxID=2621013 RepID=UPI0003AA32E1|nr:MULTISPECIES: YceD family protein [unclassified Thioalkalivibrio]
MSRIPVSLDPWQPRARHQEFEGDLSAEDLPRLRDEALAEHPLRVHVRFGLERGALDEVRLAGVITGELWQTCQRCLQPMAWEFRLETDAVILPAGGSVEGLGADEDILELEDDGRLHPAVWAEDEVLLAWPLVPRHVDCEPAVEPEFVPGQREDNPFAVLEQLKGSSSDGEDR